MVIKHGEKLYTLGDMSRAIGVGINTMRSYVARGLIEPDVIAEYSEGKYMKLFRQESYDAFIKKCSPSGYDGTEPLLSIGDIAKLLGVTPSAIQYYIKLGLLKPDISLPTRADGKISKTKFTKRTVEEFVANNKLRRGTEWAGLLENGSIQ